MFAKTTVQHVTNDEYATDYFQGLLDTIISAWLRLLVEDTIMLAIKMRLMGSQMMMYPTNTRPMKGHTIGQIQCSMWITM